MPAAERAEEPPDVLEPRDRLELERLLQWLRLSFLAMAALPPLTFGLSALPYALLMTACVAASYGWICLLAWHFPRTLLRYQLVLRVLDCALVYLALRSYHGFLGNTYYDAAYVFFVVAAAATHGRRGALVVSLAAGAPILLSRLQLIADGTLALEVRHVSDSVFYTLLFFVTGCAVAFLMRMAREVVQRRERVWRAVLRQLPAGVVVVESPSGRLILGNDQMEQIFRHPFLPPAGIEQYHRYKLFRPDGRPCQPEEVPLARSLTAGEVLTDEEIDFVRGDGTCGSMRISATPVLDSRGRVVAAAATFYDVTERKRTEEAQRFLAEASAQLAASLDYKTTLASVARLAVPHLDDWCGVDVVEENGTIRQLAVAHVDPAKVELARELRERYPPDPSAPTGVPNVLRTGRSELYPEIPDALLEASARDAAHLQLLRQLGLYSAMCVPMVARGRTLGAITFVAAESRHQYIVEQHGGTISVESQEGAGATFTVRLPLDSSGRCRAPIG